VMTTGSGKSVGYNTLSVELVAQRNLLSSA
jgi:hypothetical protein